MEPIYKDHLVIVTNSLVQVSDGTSYQIRQINSTKLTYEDPSKIGPALGGFFVGAIVGVIFNAMVVNVPVLKYLGMAMPWILGLGVAYKVWTGLKRKHFIELSTSSGEVKAFHSFDRDWVHRVNNAILEAMSKAA
ncbi:DUF6232 family protein [Bdellovibrio bacteriovorus]|uniref:DUF6232 family protein n=1 Tax=Bdellovibrio bacteriovorus TaxID=959 RepID=UPI0021D276C9|nr:DUF6232 family protein [Bdellovibrio bacteriovorus]UXR66204.1 DUF6232 family protein [Bdellovibrio bacteriovorus]